MSKPLEGVRILEVAQWWFVPSAGALLPLSPACSGGSLDLC